MYYVICLLQASAETLLSELLIELWTDSAHNALAPNLDQRIQELCRLAPPKHRPRAKSRLPLISITLIMAETRLLVLSGKILVPALKVFISALIPPGVIFYACRFYYCVTPLDWILKLLKSIKDIWPTFPTAVLIIICFASVTVIPSRPADCSILPWRINIFAMPRVLLTGWFHPSAAYT